MKGDFGRSVAPPVEPGPESARSGKRVAALAVAGLLFVCACSVILLLVLTGIIAEPVTVIEQILMVFFGGG